MQEIPLSNGSANAHQKFTCKINNQTLTFVVQYLSYLEEPAWSMDIYQDGTALAMGAMLVPGCDILQNYNAGIGRMLFVGDPVTLDNLGVDNHLVWVAE